MITLLRSIAGLLMVTMLLAGVACTSGGAPAPSVAPTKTNASSPAPSTAAPSGSAAASAAAKPVASADWKVEWDKTLAAAKQEGKIVLAGPRGESYHDALTAFSKAFPDIKLEYSAVEGSDMAPKVIAEREGEKYLWDVFVGGATTGLTVFRPKGIIDPLKPALVLPEVLDNTKWVGGFDDPWQDKELKFIYGFEGRLFYVAYVNRDIVPESELKTLDQLLDPKWKGKMMSGDPRMAGTPNGAGGHLLQLKGEDWLRKLYSQDLVLIKDERMQADNLVRGTYGIIVGLNPGAALDEYRSQGLGKNIKPLEPESAAGASLSSGRGNVALINKAPHPNAAKVFVNWLLSKDGQKAYVDTTTFNSRRLDVEGPAEYMPRPNVKYRDLNKDDMVPFKQQVMAIAKEMFK